MEKFVVIDSGKNGTKVAEYQIKSDETRVFNIPTKAADGDFRDDAIEANTVIVEIDNHVYKVGKGARGNGAELTTNKQTDTHRLCTLTALATIASAGETDEMNVAVILPAKEWANVSKRMDFKDYILPEGEMEISIKTGSDAPVLKKKFKVKRRYVFPESIGALFMDETIGGIDPNTITGVLDIGNLNLNATLWQGTELLQDKSTTAELGAAILVQELAQEISTNITPCDEMIIEHLLRNREESLPAGTLSEEQIEKSREIFQKIKLQHAQKIKRQCLARGWSLDVIRIVAIGGTSIILEKELKEVFGNSITVLSNSAFCNALGGLRMMCSRIPEINKVIPLPEKINP